MPAVGDGDFVLEQGVALRRGGDGDVEGAAVPEVGDGDPAAVEQEVVAGGVPDLQEGPRRAFAAEVEQMAVALPAVPRAPPEAPRIEEGAGLVQVLPGHDVAEEAQLQLRAAVVLDPAVGGV